VATRSVSNLLRRLSKAGFKRDFVRPAIFPDWWESALDSDTSLLPDIELRVARFLGVSLADVRDPARLLITPTAPSTVLRKSPSMEVGRLRPAIHTAHRIAEAVVRNMTTHSVVELPAEPEAWRNALVRNKDPVSLEKMLTDLWMRGIPVVPTDCLPSPAFQGMAVVIEGRPVIVIGQKHDTPSRVGFFVAHEAGHIASGDCKNGRAIVDEEEVSADSSEMERRADRYALRVQLGDSVDRTLTGTDFQKLAESAYAIETETGAEAGALLFRWAREHDDFQTAAMAVGALYRNIGARRMMARFLAENVDVQGAPETDRALLGLALGESESAAPAD
jgi:Zn-dependent peptidase ImmA (M78 family)